MGKLAKLEPPSPLNAQAAEFWDIGNRAEAEVEKLGRQAMPYVLVAGAAFHLAKAEVPHGNWEHLIEACSPISLRTVRQRMQTVDNALLKLGFPIDRRAYETIVFSSKLAKRRNCAVLGTPFAKELTGQLSAIFAGKNARQIELELNVRKPKSIAAGKAHATEEDAERAARDEALQHLTAVHEGVIALRALGGHLDEPHWNQLAWACRDGLVRCLPPKWKVQIVDPVHHKPVELDEFLAGHVGARPA